MSKDEIVELLQKIDKKLSILVGEKVGESKSTVKDRVGTLAKAGLDYNDIAGILGISPSHASKEMSKMKKG